MIIGRSVTAAPCGRSTTQRSRRFGLWALAVLGDKLSDIDGGVSVQPLLSGRCEGSEKSEAVGIAERILEPYATRSHRERAEVLRKAAPSVP